jgi:hypothetical protein
LRASVGIDHFEVAAAPDGHDGRCFWIVRSDPKFCAFGHGQALEKELLERPERDGELDFWFNYLMVLSEWWIGSAYAVCYTLKDRNILTESDFLKLADDLRMIPVQIEKYEVPSDKKLCDLS